MKIYIISLAGVLRLFYMDKYN